jgi:histidinol dehydrogenase
MLRAFESLPDVERAALRTAAARIRAYHERQVLASWSYRDADGSEFGQRVTPLDSVGVYVPGGQAAYPSSVLMNVIPAHVAGVAEIVMVVPTPGGMRNPLVLASAHLAGVSRAFAIGGAQAIAALAYGRRACRPSKSASRQVYVAAAKRRVSAQWARHGGERLESSSSPMARQPRLGRDDMFAQAEHRLAQAILVTPDPRCSTPSRGARSGCRQCLGRRSSQRRRPARDDPGRGSRRSVRARQSHRPRASGLAVADRGIAPKTATPRFMATSP